METCSIELIIDEGKQLMLFWSCNQDTLCVLPICRMCHAQIFRWRLLSPGPGHHYTISRLVTHATVRRFSQALGYNRYLMLSRPWRRKQVSIFRHFFLLYCTIAKDCLLLFSPLFVFASLRKLQLLATKWPMKLNHSWWIQSPWVALCS